MHLGPGEARRLHSQEWAAHEESPQHGIVQRLAQHPVRDTDRRRREFRLPPLPAVREDVGVQRADEQCVQVDEVHRTEARVHVPLHDLAVTLRSRRLERGQVPRQPLVDVVAHREPARIGDLAGAHRRQRAPQRPFGLSFGREPALPPLPPATRHRIAADVDDVAPRVPALYDASSHSVLHMRIAHCENSTRLGIYFSCSISSFDR